VCLESSNGRPSSLSSVPYLTLSWFERGVREEASHITFVIPSRIGLDDIVKLRPNCEIEAYTLTSREFAIFIYLGAPSARKFYHQIIPGSGPPSSSDLQQHSRAIFSLKTLLTR
jgi:hypothetical protein